METSYRIYLSVKLDSSILRSIYFAVFESHLN